MFGPSAVGEGMERGNGESSNLFFPKKKHHFRASFGAKITKSSHFKFDTSQSEAGQTLPLPRRALKHTLSCPIHKHARVISTECQE